MPHVKLVKLPKGCDIDGNNIVDIGECTTQSNSIKADIRSTSCCDNNNTNCWGPVAIDQKSVNCVDVSGF
jgi:hypothetical protein